ncbi:predicted protein [Uncinocarpus reesii 1704]|uniref:Uncharacterized protein n=1 Tax=Uncinocarpus reesii (strain UAMH 1704) TaxID=336963 RepID=C4JW23_UNCRE|nr:uncharacterized protein UREG_06765 [Uncinocarpus reesii 1704]EEP81900.1 predicted protein [Uncinocarpus reesii 1704]
MARSFNTLMGADHSNDSLFFFETSWLFTPFVFAALRGLVAFYTFFTIFFIFGWRGTHGDNISNKQSFSYFTNLTYWGIAFYFLVASLHTFVYAARGRSVSQHAMPPLFSLFEIIFSTAPNSPVLHLPFLLLILLLYLALAYIVHATQGYYTYSFLDPGNNGEDSKSVAGYSFAIAAATIGIFFFVNLISWIRLRYTREKTKMAKPMPRNGLTEAEMGMMEIPK